MIQKWAAAVSSEGDWQSLLKQLKRTNCLKEGEKWFGRILLRSHRSTRRFQFHCPQCRHPRHFHSKSTATPRPTTPPACQKMSAVDQQTCTTTKDYSRCCHSETPTPSKKQRKSEQSAPFHPLSTRYSYNTPEIMRKFLLCAVPPKNLHQRRHHQQPHDRIRQDTFKLAWIRGEQRHTKKINMASIAPRFR